jgi:hypothetical protein
VNDGIGAVGGTPNRVAIADVAVMRHPRQPGRRRPPCKDDGMMPTRMQRAHDSAAKIPRSTGDENSHSLKRW